MKYLRHITLSVLIVLIFASNSYCTNYYVSFSAGNDSWNGLAPNYTSGNNGPWKTITKVNNTTFSPGDSILFKRGDIWPGSWFGFDSSKSGTSGNRVTFDAYGTGSKPIIDCKTAAVTGWSGPVNGVYSKSGFSNVAFLFEDDKNLGPADSNSTLPNYSNANYKLKRFWYYDSNTHTVYYRPTDDKINNHTIKYSYLGLIGQAWNNNCHDIIIRNFSFIGWMQFCEASKSNVMNNITIDSCDFNEGGQIEFNSDQGSGFSNIAINNCTSNYSMAMMLRFQGQSHLNITGLTISNNRLLNANKTQFGTVWAEGSDNDIIYIQSVVNLLVEYNELSGYCSCDAAIQHWVGSSAYGCGGTIRNNFIYDVPCNAILISNGVNSSHYIYDNIIANYGYISPTQFTNRYNWCAGIWIGGYASSTKRGSIYNNTIYNGNSYGYGIIGDTPIDYYDIKNNIIVKVPLFVYYRPSNINHNNFSNNCYYPNADNIHTSFYANGTSRNWTNWKSFATESNSINLNPLFQNSSGNMNVPTDFKLSDSSPARAAGYAWPGINLDYGGYAFNTTKPSIGAWSWRGSYAGTSNPIRIGNTNDYRPNN